MLNRLSIMSSQEIRHAFFSKTQKNNMKDHKRSNKQIDHHTNIYLTTDGREVEVTEVVKDANSYNKKSFPDFVYLGQVTKWVRVKYD